MEALNSALIPIIVAAIAFIGTLLGIVVGYRKWKGEQQAERFGGFEKDRQAAYKELWERVEDLNIQVRIEEISKDEFSKKVQALNSFLLKGGIYIDDHDRALVNDYLKAVYNFQKAVRESGNEDAQIPLGETQSIPPSVTESIRSIEIAQNESGELREKLLKKIRHVLSGNSG